MKESWKLPQYVGLWQTYEQFCSYAFGRVGSVEQNSDFRRKQQKHVTVIINLRGLAEQ